MKKTVSFIGILLLLMIVFLNRSLAQAQPQTATVHIVYVAWNGNDLGKVDVQSFKSERGKEFRRLFRENTARSVPYGVYELTAGLNGFYPDKKIVDVVQPEVWVVVHLWLGDGDTVGYGPNFVVMGTVKNISPSDEPLYVRLVGVYSQYSGDTKVQASGNSGTFILSSIVPDGRYVLITTGRGGVLDMRPMSTEKRPLAPIEIDLGKDKAKSGSPDSR
jgi:hypothetical protein